ncbi:MAG: DEAD/DEAH box helicase, partial [Syntrophales bacterium]
MTLRKHQQQFKEIIDGIIAGGSPIKKIIVKATPGSGKSLIPILSGRLIAAGLADKLCWICPRMSLQDQGERNFLDRTFRDMLGHSLTIRSATNDVDPCRGTNGFISTFQALGVDRDQTVLSEFKRRRYILIIDEGHHAEAEDGAWMKAITPLYEEAAYVVFMTGTMARGDKKKIAFIPYAQVNDDEFTPCFQNSEDTALVDYSRTDALADESIIPLSFLLHDGMAKWQSKEGRERETKISTATPLAKDALFTALHTGFARELLETAVSHWQGHRVTRPSSRLLVVAANIKTTKEYTEFLQRKGLSAVIATSEDDKAALKAIKAYKAGKIDVLVTCQVA